MSSDFKYTTGLHNVGSYQVAGSPYVTSSTVSQDTEEEIQFPRVTNNVTVKLDSAGGSGTTYNSVLIYGIDIYYQNDTTVQANNGDSRTITAWLSASNVPNGLSNGSIIAGNTVNNNFIFKEKDGNPYQAQLSHSSGVSSIVNISPPSGWFHLALVASSSAYFRVLINGAQINSKTIGQTVGSALGGGLVLGPPNRGETSIKIRDAILWDNALTNAQVNDLYQASASYDDPAFGVANKLVWVKPTEDVAPSQVLTLANSGDSDTYGDMSLSDVGTSPETAEIVADAPFADIPAAGGGELRIHYRSTGSLPNVEANKHYWTLSSQDEEIKMNVKTKEIYLSAVDGDCDFSLQADLTNIPASRMYQHTGSGVDE